MLNGRNEGKYEGSDDSEYHFSDDEVNYDTESDATPKQASVNDVHSGAAPSSSGGLKRMGIGLAVFFVLVFVAYKMVSPGTSTPATEITPQAAPIAAAAPAAPAAQPQTMQAQAAPVAQQAAAPAQQTADQTAMQQQPQQQAAQQPAQQAPQQQTAIQQMQQMSAAPQEAPVNQQAAPAAPEQMQAQAQMPPQNAPQAAAPQQQQAEVIPVQSVAPAPQNIVSSTTPSQTMQQAAGETTLAVENAKLSGQLQAEYAQRINEYQSQNKNLQEQVQTLNGRVASMESEMNQLIQTLTQQFQSGGTPGAAPQQQQMMQQQSAAVPVEQAGPPPRIPYNVQAIIPGRAWLRSNNGDTLTVAEGDEIKGIGRVTKIDPYDGVVEINVQGRAVTLSYGNGS